MVEDRFIGLENALLNLEAALSQMRRDYCGKECRDVSFCESVDLCKVGVTNFDRMTNRFLDQARRFVELNRSQKVPEEYIVWFKKTAARGWDLMHRRDNGLNYLRNSMQNVNLRIELADNYSGNPIEDF